MSSKFGFLRDAKGRAAEPETVARESAPAPVERAQTPPPEPPAPPSPAPVEPPPLRRPGRPPGKRSDPSFVQVTAYVPADLHHEIKVALLLERQGREFSELVADLLSDWLKARNSR